MTTTSTARIKVNKEHRSFWLLSVNLSLRRLCLHIVLLLL